MDDGETGSFELYLNCLRVDDVGRRHTGCGCVGLAHIGYVTSSFHLIFLASRTRDPAYVAGRDSGWQADMCILMVDRVG